MHQILGRYPTLSELARALSTGAISSCDLVEASIDAHHRHGDVLNAYSFWAESAARDQASAADVARRAGTELGLLQGIPISVKDCIGVRGMPVFAGSVRQLPSKWEMEGPLVGALRRQLAVITGKTCQTEFALGAVGRTPHAPQPRNPWDPHGARSAGGSSTGAGLSLLEGSAVLALGTDTLGSVRIPASATGTVGFRPGIGYWPTAGVVPLSPTFDTIGVLARSVADLALCLSALPGQFGRNSDGALSPTNIRMALVESCWAGSAPDIAACAISAIDELAGAGARPIWLDLPEAEDCFQFIQDGSVAAAEFHALLGVELPEWRELLLPSTAMIAERGSHASAAQYLRDRQRHLHLAARARERFDEGTILVMPTLPISPPRLDGENNDGGRQVHLHLLRHVCIASCLRLCSLTLPVGFDSYGIPVGLELMAPVGSEEYLISVALAVEMVLGDARHRLGVPALSANCSAIRA